MVMTWERFLEKVIDKKMRLCPYIIEEEPQCNGAILWRVPIPEPNTEMRFSLERALNKVTMDWTCVGFPLECVARHDNFEIIYYWRFEYEDNLYDAVEVD